METVKDPAVLLGIGNTVAIVGLGLYFHKRQNAIETELEELSEHLKTSVKKFAESQKEVVSRAEMQRVLGELGRRVEETQKNVEKASSGNDDVELLEEALESLSEILEDAGMEWEYPPRKRGRRGRKKRKTRKSRRKYSEDEDSSDGSSEDSDSELAREIAKQRGRRRGGKKHHK